MIRATLTTLVFSSTTGGDKCGGGGRGERFGGGLTELVAGINFQNILGATESWLGFFLASFEGFGLPRTRLGVRPQEETAPSELTPRRYDIESHPNS